MCQSWKGDVLSNPSCCFHSTRLCQTAKTVASSLSDTLRNSHLGEQLNEVGYRSFLAVSVESRIEPS